MTYREQLHTACMVKEAILGKLLPVMRQKAINRIVRGTPVFNTNNNPNALMDVLKYSRRDLEGDSLLRKFNALSNRPVAGRYHPFNAADLSGGPDNPAAIFLSPKNPSHFRPTLSHERVHALQDQLPFFLRKPNEVLAHPNNLLGGNFFMELGAQAKGTASGVNHFGANASPNILKHYRNSYLKNWDLPSALLAQLRLNKLL